MELIQYLTNDKLILSILALISVTIFFLKKFQEIMTLSSSLKTVKLESLDKLYSGSPIKKCETVKSLYKVDLPDTFIEAGLKTHNPKAVFIDALYGRLFLKYNRKSSYSEFESVSLAFEKDKLKRKKTLNKIGAFLCYLFSAPLPMFANLFSFSPFVLELFILSIIAFGLGTYFFSYKVRALYSAERISEHFEGYEFNKKLKKKKTKNKLVIAA